jgi:hypothetical protein
MRVQWNPREVLKARLVFRHRLRKSMQRGRQQLDALEIRMHVVKRPLEIADQPLCYRFRRHCDP